MPNKFYLVVGGGLGDCLREYFVHNRLWGMLPAIKAKYPDTFIRLISCCHNPQTQEFFRFHPDLDDKLFFPWELSSKDKEREYRGDCIDMRAAFMRFWGLDWKRPSVYLSNDDMGDMMNLPFDHAQRHIVLHPFAGLGDHYAMPLERYEPLCKALTGLGYQILVIGANYIRENAANPGGGCMGGNQENRETWTLEMPGVHNLVDKLNGRTATSLIEHADGFIGSHSCWANAAWSFAIPTVVLFPSEPWVMEYITGGDPNLWAVREKRAQDMVVFKANCGSTDTMTKLIRLHFKKLMKK